MPHRQLVDDPEFWRSRAAIANDMKEADARATMERIANDYERLAKHAENRRTNSKTLEEATATRLQMSALGQTHALRPIDVPLSF